MKNLKKWFTLVELIVVITILAILWSIAFISLQGYSADARNTKRNSNLASLQSAISSKLAATQGGIMSFVVPVTASRISTAGTQSIAWFTWAALTSGVTGMYDAGTINFTNLWVKQSDFQDPGTQEDYVIGATIRKLGKYEIAATLEQGSTSVAKVVGDYIARPVTTIATTVISNTPQKRVNITSDAEYGRFFVGDRVSVGWSWSYDILWVSMNGQTLTLSGSNNLVVGNTPNLVLTAEMAGLIEEGGTPTGTVIDGLTVLPY